jgi:proteasome accessory factor B
VTARKSERLLNLLITLLVSRSYVTKDRIRAVVEQYRDAGDEAFEKMFERDKDELRSLGVPIEVGHLDPLFDDEPGYRVERAAFELPDIDLAPDEAAVVGLAARVWQHAGLASATTGALVKLKAAGVSVDREALDTVAPQLTVTEPTFEAFWSATQERVPVAFDYRTAASAETTERHLQPWGVVSYRGRWYVVGHDTDRGGERVFRLSRVQGEVRRTGRPGSYDVPPGTDVRALTTTLVPPQQELTARLRIRPGAALGLRRSAVDVQEGAGRDGWDLVDVRYGRPDAMADEVLGHGSGVVVESPEELRELVLSRLRAAAGTEVAP